MEKSWQTDLWGSGSVRVSCDMTFGQMGKKCVVLLQPWRESPFKFHNIFQRVQSHARHVHECIKGKVLWKEQWFHEKFWQVCVANHNKVSLMLLLPRSDIGLSPHGCHGRVLIACRTRFTEVHARYGCIHKILMRKFTPKNKTIPMQKRSVGSKTWAPSESWSQTHKKYFWQTYFGTDTTNNSVFQVVWLSLGRY